MKRMVSCLTLMMNASAFAADASIDQIKKDWVQAYYKTAEKDQPNAFKVLIDKTHAYSVVTERSAEALIWEATANACYAKSLKSLGGVKYAENAKNLMLEAEKTPKTPQQETVIYRTLGTLHYKIPAWPIGFGDKKAAKTYLEKALALNPNGIDTNYFYADFLSEQKEYANAVKYYKRAMAGSPSTEGEEADSGRLKEVEIGMRNAEDKLK